VLTLSGMSYESKNNAHLYCHQKSFEILDKNSADKIESKIVKEIKISPLMLKEDCLYFKDHYYVTIMYILAYLLLMDV
jgi:hypothetical protein